MGRDVTELNQIVLHLGNGASATAVRGGRSVETSMGLTPLEGLVMGTRSGDLDPAVLLHLARSAGYGIDELDSLLNRRSGMLGLSGHVGVIAFTAGVGENDDLARARSLPGLKKLGIEVAPVRNEGRKKEPTIISPDGARVTVMVMPTNEELEIARQTARLVAG